MTRASCIRPAAWTVALAFAFVASLRIAVRGEVPQLVAGVVATALLVALVAATFRLLVVLGPCAVDESGAPRPLLRRHGFWVVALGAGLALPTLGAFGLVDPWETHYAEVAREMIERRDFVSPWWANEGWFFSKPILIFWLEALSMLLFGAGTGPNAPIAGGAHPEWAVRFPAFAFALLGTYALYHGVSRTAGRRAGLIGAVVLWSAPGFALLSHQAITDMPLVAGVAGALGLFARALSLTDDAKTKTAWPGRILGAVLFIAIVGELFIIVASHSGYGSPHACGLPSQPACAALRFAHPRITPWLQASLWMPAALWLAFSLSEERRVARLFAIGAWACVALATMAKGPAGLAVPLAGCALVLLSRPLRGPRGAVSALLRLSPFTGVVVVVALVVPWYVAAFVRHGRPFIDELVFRHMLGRTLDHLHDTNGTDDVGIGYYVRQLAYATFPWSGIVAASALATAQRADEQETSRRGAVRVLLLGAGLVGFALVSMMRTKFHHYVLVAVPPLAMVAGIFVDERLGERARGRARTAGTALLLAGATATLALVARDVAASPTRFVHLFTYRYDRQWPSTKSFATIFLVLGIAFAALVLAVVVHRFRARAVAVLAAASVAFSAVLLDRYLPPCGADGGQRNVLSAYYKDRATDGAGPLVAYQLNWKGENFYTGNDVALFISSGASMKTYLARRADRTVYFVTERGRVASLKNELGAVRSFAELTGEADSHEFVLVRAEL